MQYPRVLPPQLFGQTIAGIEQSGPFHWLLHSQMLLLQTPLKLQEFTQFPKHFGIIWVSVKHPKGYVSVFIPKQLRVTTPQPEICAELSATFDHFRHIWHPRGPLSQNPFVEKKFFYPSDWKRCRTIYNSIIYRGRYRNLTVLKT